MKSQTKQSDMNDSVESLKQTQNGKQKKLDVKIDLVSLHQNAAAAHQQDRDSKEREAVESTHSKGDFNIKT